MGRGVFGFPNLYNTLNCQDVSIYIKILAVGFVVQSLYYIHQMIYIFISRRKEYLERKRKGVHMRWFQALTSEEIGKIDLYTAKARK